ncbi:MAG: DNA alkylation repair protein [Anaerolineales bacterium]|nr:DNA alkylation repair protein [Anaerolineales bacterium]
MTAIQPDRLKQQAAQLAEHFADPAAYVHELHQLLDYYADRVRRPGQAGRPAPLTPAYNVRPPVLRALLAALLPRLQADPQNGLALCDALWEQPYLEFRMLAILLLGQAAPDPPEAIVQRIKSWITPALELQLIESLLSLGVERLHRECPMVLLQLIRQWLENTQPFYQQLGLRALLPFINNPAFENLPVFFRLITPLCQSAPSGLRADLLDVLAALARRSPQETAYFLRQVLAYPDAPDTPWLIRQSLNEFPPEIQAGLRSALRAVERRPTAKRSRPR